jgi:hypothetical protein
LKEPAECGLFHLRDVAWHLGADGCKAIGVGVEVRRAVGTAAHGPLAGKQQIERK